MVFLATTKNGFIEAQNLALGQAIWCGADAISETDFSALTSSNTTRFGHSLDSADSIADALTTIGEHHPGERVWVEYEPAL